ncbi:MAG: hypothetical protein P1U68_11560 [Verrucomicrobiales bacterium]|nr:hypothetical protein [Verrucomicrobiales bacterium]
MRAFAGWLSMGVIFAFFVKAEEAAPSPQVELEPVASLDIANTAEGAYPGGATPLSGSWYTEKSAVKLKAKAEPLVMGSIEFGPEIREKGATICALARGPGGGRLKSRFGAGLYGKNGFCLRIDQGKQVMELVRRGMVIKAVEFKADPETLYEIELNVVEDAENWMVTGRVWEYEADRPKEPAFTYRMYSDELLFPLAGRPFLVATPFSGEPVQFAVARAYMGNPFDPAPEEEVEVKD